MGSPRPRHSVSTGAIVIRDDGRLLAVQRNDTGAWVTPAESWNRTTSLVDGATREVFEETGTAIDVGGLVGVYQNVSTDVVSFVFRASSEGARTVTRRRLSLRRPARSGGSRRTRRTT